MSSPSKASLQSLAFRLGFDAIGFAPPTPSTWNAYAAWIQQEYHGTMTYLANRLDERREPGLLLDNVQTVILLAKSYLEEEPPGQPAQGPTGRIARYGWGLDYHDVLRARAQILCDWITSQTLGQHRCRIFVDSSPVMETDLAAQTHIGWKGKNTVLVSPALGQWFLLSGILTTWSLEPDEPTPSHCGRCQRCLDACPTQAFVAPYVLDARKCISYWTIEYKGIIPEDIRPSLGNHIFGCDECIAVCPWNRFAQTAPTQFFHSRPELATVPLIEWMRMDQPTFKSLFHGTPIERLKRKRLLRNVAIALGNSDDPEAIPALRQASQDPEELIRIHATWALHRLLS
ncbi:MAG: tRNA epoxyqueuosine(34) reductase QueG [bacterium]|jgi:epoxyqueuosine reductase|nr:tRNA epoxyqueuosine(34) reductase QueG [bacterium]